MSQLKRIKRYWPFYFLLVVFFVQSGWIYWRLNNPPACPLPHKAAQVAQVKPSPSASTPRTATRKAKAEQDAFKPVAKATPAKAASKQAADPPPVIASMPSDVIWVKGYYRKDGRWVEPYARKAPVARQV
jgi:hypothetical protein